MPRKKKSYFFGNTSNKLFKTGDKPDQQTYEDLLDSATFPTELEDRAKRTEAGLVKTTTDVKVNACDDKDDQGISPCGFPTFAKPSQIPKLLAGVCIQLQRVNRTTGTVPNTYSISLDIASCIPNGVYTLQLVGIEPTLIDTFELAVDPAAPTAHAFTNNGGIISFSVTQTNASDSYTLVITMLSGFQYTITFDLDQTAGGALCDGVINNTAIVAPPYNPDPLTEDGSNTEDWRISVDRECLDIPEVAADILYGGETKDIKTASFTESPCDGDVVVNQVIANDNLEKVLCDMINSQGGTADAVAALADFVCQLKQDFDDSINNAVGVEIGDIVLSFTPPNTWSDSYLEANGQSVLVSEYPDLFALFGYTYGGGGANFNLPDVSTNDNFLRVVPGTTSVANGSGGAESYTLDDANIPDHTHSIPQLTGETAIDGTHSHPITTDVELTGSLVHDDGTGPEVAAAQDGGSSVNGQANTDPATGGHQHSLTTFPNNTGVFGNVSPTPVDTVPPYVECYAKIRVK